MVDNSVTVRSLSLCETKVLPRSIICEEQKRSRPVPSPIHGCQRYECLQNISFVILIRFGLLCVNLTTPLPSPTHGNYGMCVLAALSSPRSGDKLIFTKMWIPHRVMFCLGCLMSDECSSVSVWSGQRVGRSGTSHLSAAGGASDQTGAVTL